MLFTVLACLVETGKDCEVAQAPCASHPCEKGGVCRPTADYTSYTCRCPAGWQGMCLSVGTCVSDGVYNKVTYVKVALHARLIPFAHNDSGARCSEDVNECKKNPCKNGGRCINSQGSYTCICQPGYSGHNCQTDIDDCTPSEFHFSFFFPPLT